MFFKAPSMPAIPEYLSFVISFAGVGMLAGLIKFQYSLRRSGNDKRHPCAHAFSSILGLTQLALGIWGMALVFPNVAYLSNPSPETCEIGPMIAMLIPSIIIAIVLAGLVGYGIYSFVVEKRSE